MKTKHPTEASGISRRSFLKVLTVGSVLVTAGSLTSNPGWSWFTIRSDHAFTAKASGQVTIKSRGLGKRATGDHKLGMGGHPKHVAKNVSAKKKASV